MLTLEVSDGQKLIVDSAWDSCTHCNFNAAVVEDGGYYGKSLDKVLSKTQISALECLLATFISESLEANLVDKEK